MVMKFEASWNDRKFHAATEQSEINKLMNSGFISGNETEWIKFDWISWIDFSLSGIGIIRH